MLPFWPSLIPILWNVSILIPLPSTSTRLLEIVSTFGIFSSLISTSLSLLFYSLDLWRLLPIIFRPSLPSAVQTICFFLLLWMVMWKYLLLFCIILKVVDTTTYSFKHDMNFNAPLLSFSISVFYSLSSPCLSPMDAFWWLALLMAPFISKKSKKRYDSCAFFYCVGSDSRSYGCTTQ